MEIIEPQPEKLSDKALNDIMLKYKWHNKGTVCKCYMCKLIKHVKAITEESEPAFKDMEEFREWAKKRK